MPLSRQLWASGIPLLVCRSVGFLGYVRLQIKEHTVIEAHPDNETPDLRLDRPWPTLFSHLNKIDVANLGTKERSHVPALVILFHYLKKFKEVHEDQLPKTRGEKEELKRMIRSSLPGDHDILEENYEQAIHLINVSVCLTKIPSQIQDILDDEQCINLTSEVCNLIKLANII